MDGVKLAGRLAVTAGDALVIANLFRIHFADPHAGVAVDALGFIHFDGKQRVFVEETVKGAQRTDKTAERPEQENRENQDPHQHHETVIVNHVRPDRCPGAQRHKKIRQSDIGADVMAP